MIELDKNALGSKTMEKAFEQMQKLRGLVDPNFPGRDWNLATAMVINGKAGMQIMGDWAKGEFLKAGKKPNVDFLCFQYPGTEGSFTFNSDAFAMFKVGKAQEAGQLALASAIMDKNFQEQFNLAKGSIPARMDVSDANFDACGKKSMADLKVALKNNAHARQLRAWPRGARVDQGRDDRRGDQVLQLGRISRRRHQAAGGGGAEREVTQSRRPGAAAPPCARPPRDPAARTGCRPFAAVRCEASDMATTYAEPLGPHAATASASSAGCNGCCPSWCCRPTVVDHAGLRLRLHPVDHLSVVHQVARAIRCTSWSAGCSTSACGHHPRWQVAMHNLAVFGVLYVVLCMSLGPAARDPARSAHPPGRHAARDLSVSAGAVVHRHRHGLEMDAQSRAGHREAGARLGLRRTSSSTGS